MHRESNGDFSQVVSQNILFELPELLPQEKRVAEIKRRNRIRIAFDFVQQK